MLLLVPGLGSGTQSTYIKRLIKELSREFKCVYVQYRAQGGIPVTSNKLYSGCSWPDLKEVVDHIHEKHCKANQRPMYLYGVSMGAANVAKYLIEAKADTPIKAACIYGIAFNCTEGFKMVKHAGAGQYTKVFGAGYCRG